MLIMLCADRASRRDSAAQWRTVHALMTCCAAVFLIDIPGLLLDGCVFPGARALLWLFDTLYWLLHIVYCWLWTRFVREWTDFGGGALRRRWLYALPLICEFALILTNPLTGWLFVLDEGNIYAPGTAYYLCLIPHCAYVLISLALTVRGCVAERDFERKRRSLSLLAYMFLPICALAMELLAYGVSWLWPTIALSLLMLYLSMQQQTLSDERLRVARAAEEAARLEAEMANSRMAIMLSQIQPHFLYNALCVIQDLCHGKAPEAEQATLAFSRFLRGNLDSLKADKPIPFSQELDHTRYYLTLEQMRFGDRLKLEYALEANSFRLPAMTLQPIVENAVRYGVMKREEGGTLRIASKETDADYLVTVSDDGVGFDPYQKHADGRTHIGIDNVRNRLREMCGGDLEIASTRDVGTVATIRLPKGVKRIENSGG